MFHLCNPSYDIMTSIVLIRYMPVFDRVYKVYGCKAFTLLVNQTAVIGSLCCVLQHGRLYEC
jgi:hypothetical protein